MNSIARISSNLIVLLLLISIGSCSEETKPEGIDHFKYFPQDHSERQFIFDNGNGFYVDLPKCYKNTNYGRYSITNEENYKCEENKTYFTIDHFTPKDVSYYKKYFTKPDTSKNYSTKEVILNYVINSRASNLEIHNSSIFTELKTKSGIEMTLIAVKGSKTNFSNPLYYEYGIFKLGEDYFVLQFIINEGDISFYHEDILKVFRSIRES